jgi:hypothetical protein
MHEAKSAQDEALAAVDAAAALFGVTMQPDWRVAAAANFATVAAAARLVSDFPLEDEAEYAPVFRA